MHEVASSFPVFINGFTSALHVFYPNGCSHTHALFPVVTLNCGQIHRINFKAYFGATFQVTSKMLALRSSPFGRICSVTFCNQLFY
jgi:hypothetical protein